MQQTLIDRIVANVLEQLQHNGAVVRPSASEQQTAKLRELRCDEPVITAATLEDALRSGEQTGTPLVIGPRSVLTPSARDLLKTRKINWRRCTGRKPIEQRAANATSRRQVLLTLSNDIIQTVCRELEAAGTGNRPQLLAGADETAAAAISAICRGEADEVVIITPLAEVVACLSNRNEKVRAAVVRDLRLVAPIREHLNANVWCIDPTGKSYIELRNISRTICQPLATSH